MATQHKHSTAQKRHPQDQQYCIKIVKQCESGACTLSDVILASSLVDAFAKAQGIVNDLNTAVDRDTAFEIKSISRKD